MRARTMVVLWLVCVVLTSGITACCCGLVPRPGVSEATAVATAEAAEVVTEMVPGVPTDTPISRLESSPAPGAPAWTIEELHSGNAGAPAVVVDRQGVLHAASAWVGGTADNEFSVYVYYESRTPDGAWSDRVEVSSATWPDFEYPTLAVAVDSHNRPHLAWAEPEAILYAGRDENGLWLPSVAVDATVCPDCSPQSPAIAIDAEDEIHLLWHDRGQILGSGRPPKGEWSPPTAVSVESEYGEACDNPSISVDGDDALHAVWTEGDCYECGACNNRVMYSYKPREGSWSAPVVVSGGAEKASTAIMAIDSTHTVHIVWFDQTRSEGEILYTHRAPGGTWSAPVAIPVEVASTLGFGTLTVVGGDNLFLMWSTPTMEGTQSLNYATKLVGESWSTSASIPYSEGYSFTAAGDLDGNVHVLWSKNWLHYTVGSITRIALPPVIIAEYTPPDGVVEFAVTTVPDEYSRLAISSSVIVWDAQGEQDRDIFGYDLSTRSELTITTHEGDQFSPAISGNVVVWQDNRDTTPRIYGFDLSDRQEFPVTAQSSPQWQPDISGSIVVFRDWRKTGTCSWGGSIFGPGTYCDWDIWGADLETREEFPISTAGSVQGLPRVSGDSVTWDEEVEDSGRGIYGYQLGGTAQPVQIATLSGYSHPAVDGDIVVWEDYWIFGYHLPDRGEFPIAVGAASKGDPDISRNVIVWADYRNGNGDIYGYDLASGEEFPICTAPGDQMNPVIDGDMVVWLDKRNFCTEIYSARLSFANDEQTESIVPAPTPTPIPTSTPSPTPTPTPTPPALPSPVPLSPANNSEVDTLVPIFRFDLGAYDPNVALGWSLHTSPDRTGCDDDCTQEEGSSVVECVPGDNLVPETVYTWWVEVEYVDCAASNCTVSSGVWSFTTPSEVVIPPAPVLVQPPDGATVEEEYVDFEWQMVESAVRYQWAERQEVGEVRSNCSYFGPGIWLSIGPGRKGETRTYHWGVRARTYYAYSEWAEATCAVSP
jgi:beta propeller repeat protein